MPAHFQHADKQTNSGRSQQKQQKQQHLRTVRTYVRSSKVKHLIKLAQLSRLVCLLLVFLAACLPATSTRKTSYLQSLILLSCLFLSMQQTDRQTGRQTKLTLKLNIQFKENNPLLPWATFGPKNESILSVYVSITNFL